MKNLKIFLALTLSLATSCIDDDYDELTGNEAIGGLISINKTTIAFIAGNNDTYSIGGNVYQGSIQTEAIEVYKSFTSAVEMQTSNEVLLATLDIEDIQIGTSNTFSISFDFEDLISDLTVSDGSLPETENHLNNGDFWNLRFKSKLSNGNTVSSVSTTKVTVGSRFSGSYRALQGEYYRIGMFLDFVKWPAETVVESVPGSTSAYKFTEYFGPFFGNEFYFNIDPDGKITFPELTPDGEEQSGNGNPIITCANAFFLPNVPCGDDSNIAIRDPEFGADRLIMSFGYYVLNQDFYPGPREFYHVLEKIIE